MLSTYYVPDNIPGTRDTATNRQITSPALLEFTFQSRETDNNHVKYRSDGDESPLFMD